METYFLKCLGDTTEEIIEGLREFRSAWGNIHRTTTGVMLSFLAICIRVALQAQARVYPIFESGSFVGVVLSGSAFTIDLEGTVYRPVSRETLSPVIALADSHAIALVAISKKAGNDAQQKRVLASTSMVELREILRAVWTIEMAKDDVLRLAKGLRFKKTDAPWGINVNTLTKALTLITQPALPLESNLPLHNSMLFESDRTKVVWSCFGGMAPSFRIPGGRPMSLTGPMTVPQRGAGGKKVDDIHVSKVACRNVILEVAIRDLKEMMDLKEILNPFGTPNQKASQMNQDRFFSGDDGKAIIALLRSSCGVSAADLSTGKRKAQEVEESGAKKQKRGAFGF
jgi:hypothetical protein